MNENIKAIIEDAFQRVTELSPKEIESNVRPAVEQVLQLMELGELRVAEPKNGNWQINEWLKKTVLLYFKIMPNRLMGSQPAPCFDKIPLRFENFDEADFRKVGARVVPGAVVRHGSYIGPDVILMPSFINIGAYIDSGTMIDTWATVGSCAQIGKKVHISGGAGIGGVLEPLQALPTIIEDNCFIGARSEIVEGVIVECGSVIGMGVFISQSTRIYNRMTGEIHYGRVPAGSVVVAGNLPAADDRYGLYAAIIVKQVDEKTRSKTSINELLRGVE